MACSVLVRKHLTPGYSPEHICQSETTSPGGKHPEWGGICGLPCTRLL